MRGKGADVQRECQRCHTLTWFPGTVPQCKPCLREQGLHECGSCHELALVGLSMFPKKGVCKACAKKRRPRRRPGPK